MMTPEQQYPSTEDCALTFKDGEDLVLACLRNSRERIRRGHTRAVYISTGGSVCAIGAVLAEDGVKDVHGVGGTMQISKPDKDGYEKWYREWEDALSQEARDAIRLLNESAVELFPESAEFDSWSGPLEWVNQRSDPDENTADGDEDAWETTVKRDVLSIYDRAIEQRGLVCA